MNREDLCEFAQIAFCVGMLVLSIVGFLILFP